MKKIALVLCTAIIIISCKTENTENKETTVPQTETVEKLDMTAYPQDLQDVLAAHGGLENWKNKQSLTFTMSTEKGSEVHTTDLQSRDALIETDKYQIGAVNGKVWLAQDSTYYPKDRARFYHNLMFYFYAMPFILADDGIVYSETQALEKDGVSYPGIKVGYESNVGDSPDDEYILYYHPDTHNMEWLAYTVTYGKDSKSTQFKFIKYNKWQDVNGLLLPQELTWYTVVDGLPTEPAGRVRTFSKVDIDASDMGAGFYLMPENGIYVDD